MVAVAVVALMAISAFGADWTGKIDEIYDINVNEMRPESAVYDDGYLYLSHIKGETIYKIDIDDLDDGETTKSSKVQESDPHDLPGTYYPIGCCEGKSDRIYCTLGSLTQTVTNNGIGWWDMSSLDFESST